MNNQNELDKMTEQQMDNELRKLGYDPEKIGYRGMVLSRVCLKNLELNERIKSLSEIIQTDIIIINDLKEKLKNKEWLKNEWEKLTKE